MTTYKCLNCNKECEAGHPRVKKNKYCSNRCQGLFVWKTKTVPRIEKGECKEPVTLRKYLIETFGEQCVSCNIGQIWNNKPITLHVDHIDGDSDNNIISNLRLLCPNCHSQTETFGCKGQGNRYRKKSKRAVYNRKYRASLV